MRSRRVKHMPKRVMIAVIVFFVIIGGLVCMKLARYIPALFDLTFKKEIQLKETEEKRINVLLLGVGGGTHEGPNLTDTIIFASIDPHANRVTLVSIPRDLWVPDLRAKINAMYVFGEEKNEGDGLKLAKETVSKVLGQPVDYATKVDFSGFERAVDMVGGLTIDVANTFDDYSYPITGLEIDPCGFDEIQIASLSAEIATGSATESEAFPCRYEYLHFDKGEQHMDGETALKYVRSRHALGSEGSDFARSKRQEKVLSAFRGRILSAETLLNPGKIIRLLDVLGASVETDAKDNELDDFIKLVQKMKDAKLTSITLDVGDGDRYGLLYNPRTSSEYGFAWVLIPRKGNGAYSEIQAYVSCSIDVTGCEVGKSGIITPTPTALPVE